MNEGYFGVIDFVMLGGVLALSLLIGIYCAYRDRKIKSTESYYFGDRQMSPFPLGFSMAVSFISAITMIGTPVEVYLYGVVTAWICVANMIAITFACVYFIPLIYRLKLTSIYEYLGMRFSKAVRISCSSVSLLMMVIYMGIAVYIPSLALNAVTPLDINWTIAITSIICTLYTTLGGFKAVVWTDVLQSAIMIIGTLALVIKGTILVGGPQQVWDAVNRGGRINIFKITSDPTVRSSLFAILIGHTFVQASSTCTNQAMAQRMLSCNSVKNARKALVFFLIPSSVIFLLVIASGCVLYAYFEGCDPLLSEKIARADQSIPYMMVRVFQDVPGMAGVFVAAACSGTLSTVSTGINSMSVIILQDYVLYFRKSLNPRQKLLIGKCCGLVIGCLVALIAYMTGLLGKTIIQIATTILGSFGGPIFGIFLMGMFFPKANTKGVLIGLAFGATFSIWIAMGALAYGLSPEKQQKLPVSAENCTWDVISSNSSMATSIPYFNHTVTTEEIKNEPRPPIADTFYSISFFCFGFLGSMVTIIFGIIGSYATGGNDVSALNPYYFVPLVDNKLLPDSVRNFFRFGVPLPDSKVLSIVSESEKKKSSNESFQLLEIVDE